MKNATMAVAGYGTRKVYVEVIETGISVVPGEETGTSRGRSWNPMIVTSGSFSITVVSATYDEYQDLNQWLKVYVDKLSSGGAGPMRVRVPSRDFDKVAVPSTGIRFGRSNFDFFWRQTFGFVGTSEALDLTNTDDLTQISGAYTSTYYEQGGSPGEYLSSYAIASSGDAVLAARSEALYDAPTRNPFIGGPS